MAQWSPNPAAEAVGHSFHTPDQQGWRAGQKRVPSASGDATMHMTTVTQDRDGTCWVRDLEPDANGWLDPPCDYGRRYGRSEAWM